MGGGGGVVRSLGLTGFRGFGFQGFKVFMGFHNGSIMNNDPVATIMTTGSAIVPVKVVLAVTVEIGLCQ